MLFGIPSTSETVIISSMNLKPIQLAPRLVLLFLGLLILITGCELKNGGQGLDQPEIPFRPDGLLEVIKDDGSTLVTFVIEIAEGDSARQRGLMQRTSLPARGGMLFLDDESKIQTFWMRNTPLPLDLIFIDADSQIVSISRRATPFTDQTISSADTAMYVLEVNAGMADRYKIDETMKIKWRRQ